MKLVSQLRRIINEAVGVPSNILESATELYDDIYGYLKDTIDPNNEVKDYKDLTFIIDKIVKISDMWTISIKIIFDIVDHPSVVYIKMSYNRPVRFTPTHSITHKEPILPQISIGIKLGAPYSNKASDIITFWEDNKSRKIAVLAHELSHTYNFYKNPKQSLETAAEYKASLNQISGNIPVLREFLFGSYFLTKDEILVRPSQLYSELMSNNVTKGKFLEEYNKSDLVQQLKLLRSLTYEKLYNDLEVYYPSIRDSVRDKLLKGALNSDPDTRIWYEELLRDDSKENNLQIFLYFIRLNMIQVRTKIFQDLQKKHLGKNGENILEVPSYMTEKYTEYFNSITQGGKFYERFNLEESKKLNEKFFTEKIDNISLNAGNTLKKISKVYSLLPDDQNSQTLNKKINMRVKPTNEQNSINKDYLFEVSGNTPFDFTDITIPKTLPKKT